MNSICKGPEVGLGLEVLMYGKRPEAGAEWLVVGEDGRWEMIREVMQWGESGTHHNGPCRHVEGFWLSF